MGMTQLKLTPEQTAKLITQGQTYKSLNFNFFEMRFNRAPVQPYTWPKPEVYEWLNETIGEHVGCYRVCQRFFYQSDKLEEFHKHQFTSFEDWSNLNPEFPKARWGRWSHTRNAINFADPADASLFKLTWF